MLQWYRGKGRWFITSGRAQEFQAQEVLDETKVCDQMHWENIAFCSAILETKNAR